MGVEYAFSGCVFFLFLSAFIFISLIYTDLTITFITIPYKVPRKRFLLKVLPCILLNILSFSHNNKINLNPSDLYWVLSYSLKLDE